MAWVPSLAQELLYAMGTAKKKKKRMKAVQRHTGTEHYVTTEAKTEEMQLRDKESQGLMVTPEA